MKKLVTAIVIASIGAAFAQSVVYDYKASIKRLDITMKSGKISEKTLAGKTVKKQTILQKYSVKSDTIQGYVALPLCVGCDGTVDYSALELGFDAYAYLTLKGDKFSKVITRPEYISYNEWELFENYMLDVEKLDKNKNEVLWTDVEGYGWKNQKLQSKNYLYLLKSPVDARSAMFGSDQNVKDGAAVNQKANNKVWLALDFYMPSIFEIGAAKHIDSYTVKKAHLAESIEENALPQLGDTVELCEGDGIALPDVESVGRLLKDKNYAAEPFGKTLLYLGFLGMGNNGFGSFLVDLYNAELDDEYTPILVTNRIQNAGFGTLKTDKTPELYSVCGDDVNSEECNIINSVSGTLVGYPNYLGICDHTPMWDFCTIDQEINDAVISGTWSLKYNKKMTANYNSTSEGGDLAILKQFKVTASYLYEVDEAGVLIVPDEFTQPNLFHGPADIYGDDDETDDDETGYDQDYDQD